MCVLSEFTYEQIHVAFIAVGEFSMQICVSISLDIYGHASLFGLLVVLSDPC